MAVDKENEKRTFKKKSVKEYDQKKYENRLVLHENLVVTGKSGMEYEILPGERLAIGGESVVYKAKIKGTRKYVVAKIYDHFNSADVTKRMRMKELLEQADEEGNHYLMPLLDDTKLSFKNGDLSFDAPVDILPFCTKGSLEGVETVDYTQLRKVIVPHILKAIEFLHRKNYQHRDIKPSNIYFYKKKYILADFSFMSSIDEELDYAASGMRRGTPGYMAPEVNSGGVTGASDYFSLGCTIATLFNHGEHVYKSILWDPHSFYESIKEYGVPIVCEEGEESLQILVNLLTQYEVADRGGKEAVELWLKDEKEFVDKYTDMSSRNLQKSFSFVFENVRYDNVNDLVNAMAANWECAKEYMYNGGTNNSALVNAFVKIDQTVSVKIDKLINEGDSAGNKDLGIAQALAYMQKKGPVHWVGRTYRSYREIAESIEEQGVENSFIGDLLKCGFLSWKMKQEKENDELIENLKRIETVAKKYTKMAVCCFKYCFLSDNPSCLGERDEDGLFWKLCYDRKVFYENQKEILEDDDILGFLMSLGHYEAVEKYREELSDQSDQSDYNIVAFFRLFEVISSDKMSVRRYYYQYGPYSFLYWLQKNLDNYTFKGKNAENLKKEMTKILLNENDSIGETNNKLTTLYEYEKKFRELLANNFLLQLYGILNVDDEKEDDKIIPLESNGYYTDDFLFYNVPEGYIKYMGIQRRGKI